MRIALACLLCLAAPPALAQGEDAAHRADRLRTEALNRSAARAAASRDRGDAGQMAEYRAALRRYEQDRADWRRRYDACVGGEASACR